MKPPVAAQVIDICVNISIEKGLRQSTSSACPISWLRRSCSHTAWNTAIFRLAVCSAAARVSVSAKEKQRARLEERHVVVFGANGSPRHRERFFFHHFNVLPACIGHVEKHVAARVRQRKTWFLRTCGNPRKTTQNN